MIRQRDGRAGVFLIHGLGGTEYDLGSMHKRLKNAGFVTHSLTLPGHGTNPEDLLGVTAEDWLDAVPAALSRARRGSIETLHVMGMCMGSLLAVEVAKQEQHRKGRLVVLAPPIYSTAGPRPGTASLRHAALLVPAGAARHAGRGGGSVRHQERAAARASSRRSSSAAKASTTAGFRSPAFAK